MRPKVIKKTLDLRRLSEEDKNRIEEVYWARIHRNYGGSTCWRFGLLYPDPLRSASTVKWHDVKFPAFYFSYALHHGVIRKGYYIWHTCGILNCVNPAHIMYGDYAKREAWYNNRPQLTGDQLAELRRLYRDQHKNIPELRAIFGLTDREVRRHLFG